ncbi:MAG: glycosyltransferase family 4 protein [Armatimonadetes bacterium]|nr:glycosyltransferase family 4 protein [Armatimonadota bacterium]
MNVIIVNDYGMVNGGAGKVALESAVALTGHVDNVHVFACIGEAAKMLKQAPNMHLSLLHQSKVTDQPFSKSVGGGLWNKEVEAEFPKVLDQYDPKDTIVHVHSWRDGTTLSFIPEVLRRRFPLVFTAHDYGLACPIAGFFDHRTNTICEHKGMSGPCLRANCTNTSIVKKSWFSLRHRLQTHKALIPAELRHLIVVSQMSEEILRPYLNDQTKTYFVPNPISVEKGPRIEAEKNQTYAFVGRFSPEKGPLLAARAAHETGVPIIFIGTGPLATEIRPLCPEAELAGWRKPEEVRQLLTKARALIFPSVWYEAQGMVVDEAAANGLPAIVSNATAAVEAVDRYRHGSVFESGNLDALVRRIKECEHDEVIQTFSHAGYESYWKQPHDMDNHLRHLLEVYEKVLANPN